MTQETETPPLELAMVSCAACDLMFMASERRQTCPTCGGEAAGPYFEFVLDGSGLHQKDGAAAAAAQPPPTEETPPAEAPPAEEVPVEGEAPVGEGIALEPADVLLLMVASYLRDGEATEDDLQTTLTDLGVEREAAVTAVGRLTAVRDLIRELVGGGVEAEVEAGVEVSPEAAPEPSPEGDNGSQAP